MTRAYHGEHIREGQWQRMFTPHLNSVIPMDHRYLAEHDGSELAAGRGSGREEPLNLRRIRFGKNQIPYMHMTYAPIERRLDMAIFRALFASSARQARQFVIHGQVKVNGKKVWRICEHRRRSSADELDAISRISSQSRRHVPSRAGSGIIRHRNAKTERSSQEKSL